MYDCGAQPAYGRHHLKKLRNLDMTQIMNLTPSKKLLLHLLVPPSSNIFSMWCQYFGDKILIVKTKLISLNIYFIICGGTTYIVWHCHSAK